MEGWVIKHPHIHIGTSITTKDSVFSANLKFTFPPATWAFLVDMDQLTRRDGQLLWTSALIRRHHLNYLCCDRYSLIHAWCRETTMNIHIRHNDSAMRQEVCKRLEMTLRLWQTASVHSVIKLHSYDWVSRCVTTSDVCSPITWL